MTYRPKQLLLTTSSLSPLINININHHLPYSSSSTASTTMSEFPPASLRPLIEEIFDLLRARKETISVAETVPLPSLTPP